MWRRVATSDPLWDECNKTYLTSFSILLRSPLNIHKWFIQVCSSCCVIICKALNFRLHLVLPLTRTVSSLMFASRTYVTISRKIKRYSIEPFQVDYNFLSRTRRFLRRTYTWKQNIISIRPWRYITNMSRYGYQFYISFIMKWRKYFGLMLYCPFTNKGIAFNHVPLLLFIFRGECKECPSKDLIIFTKCFFLLLNIISLRRRTNTKTIPRNNHRMQSTPSHYNLVYLLDPLIIPNKYYHSPT